MLAALDDADRAAGRKRPRSAKRVPFYKTEDAVWAARHSETYLAERVRIRLERRDEVNAKQADLLRWEVTLAVDDADKSDLVEELADALTEIFLSEKKPT
jgi:hypothetical protein